MPALDESRFHSKAAHKTCLCCFVNIPKIECECNNEKCWTATSFFTCCNNTRLSRLAYADSAKLTKMRDVKPELSKSHSLTSMLLSKLITGGRQEDGGVTSCFTFNASTALDTLRLLSWLWSRITHLQGQRARTLKQKWKGMQGHPISTLRWASGANAHTPLRCCAAIFWLGELHCRRPRKTWGSPAPSQSRRLLGPCLLQHRWF